MNGQAAAPDKQANPLIVILKRYDERLKTLEDNMEALKKENQELRIQLKFALQVAKTSSPCFSDFERANAIDKVCEVLGERANIEHVNYATK